MPSRQPPWSSSTDGVIGVSARVWLLHSGCWNVVRVERPQHQGGAPMNYYGGLDVSLEETAICVVDGSGLIVKEVRAASEPEALIAALKAIDVPLERIGLEACSLTAWLHDGSGALACRRSASRRGRRTLR